MRKGAGLQNTYLYQLQLGVVAVSQTRNFSIQCCNDNSSTAMQTAPQTLGFTYQRYLSCNC